MAPLGLGAAPLGLRSFLPLCGRVCRQAVARCLHTLLVLLLLLLLLLLPLLHLGLLQAFPLRAASAMSRFLHGHSHRLPVILPLLGAVACPLTPFVQASCPFALWARRSPPGAQLRPVWSQLQLPLALAVQ